MVKEVVWGKRAFNKFQKIVEYLLKEWSEKVAEEFIDKSEEKIELLKNFPNIGLKSTKKVGLRKINLSKQNMLVYRIKEDKIIILNIYDTRQDPVKIDF